MSDLAERIAADLPASGLRIDVSAVEILGDAVRDLFADADAAPAPVRVAVDAAGAVVMSGHRALPAAGPDDVIAAIRRAFASRTTRATLKNDTSSRSHLVLRIALWRPPEVAADASPAGGPHAGETPAGEIKLVDLSGSERVSDTAAHDAERLKESAHINSSLMALKECLRKRSGSPADAKHMPFRNSKLTLLLKDSLELNPDVPTKTVMIACVAPTIADVSHSLNTFRYASTLKTTADDSGAHGSHLKPESAAALAGAAQKPKQTPMAWSKDKLERWLNDKIGGLHSLTTLLGKDGDPRLAGPHRFVPPAWKFIYELPPDEWAKRLAASLSTEEALAVRTEYRKLFVKPRSTVEGQVPGAAADHVESILLAEDAPDVVAAKVTKSSSSLEARQAAALAKLKAKGEAARKKALADQDSSKPVTARSAPRSSN
nr:hypothetical protein HK105_003466 [Polyrhizophydium stewartii]